VDAPTKKTNCPDFPPDLTVITFSISGETISAQKKIRLINVLGFVASL
jgi:hypothetical protein